MAALPLLTRGTYEPMPRFWHASARVESKAVVHGGRTKDYSEKTKQRLASVVEVFDLYTELWEQKEVTGDAPAAGVHSATCASVNGDLYHFGGFDGGRYYNSLHKLKNISQWFELCPLNQRPESPMAKGGADMIAFDDHLAVFGGLGVPHGPTQPGSSFIMDTRVSNGRGWTNEFHIFSLKEGVWSSPTTTGERPPPCSGFSLTAIDSRRAVLFGGKNGVQGKSNDVYIIELQIMHWIKLSKVGPWPEERTRHAACCLNYGQRHTYLWVTGGINAQDKILGDGWVLDVNGGRWRKTNGPLRPRWGHSVTAFSLTSELTEVTTFGGSADTWTGMSWLHSKLAHTTIHQFYCYGQSEWDILPVAEPFNRLSAKVTSLLMSVQRAEEGRQLAEKAAKEAKEKADEAMEVAQRERERANRAEEMVALMEKRELEQEVKKQPAEAMQKMSIVAEQQEEEGLAVSQVQPVQIAEKDRKEEGKERVLLVEERARLAENRADQLQARLDEIERREEQRLAVHHQAITAEHRGPTWEVKEEDLQLTQEYIGTGGWAEVRVAHLKVAAKTLHCQLVYDYHRQLFQREMSVAARVNHPNLLRFLGAKIEGGMAILMELMPTSLRNEIDRGHSSPEHRLSQQHILSIGTDVACALNYLHHFTPDPIIHGDLSSANVLLRPTPSGGWLAKVSDYGSANFQRMLTTRNPGSPVYAALESHNPDLQSSKMDIYSFGVLLIEMCTCEFPDPERRPDLMLSIQQPQLVELTSMCLESNPNNRLTAAKVINYLHTLQ